MSNPWTQIDELKKRFENELREASNAIESMGGIKGSTGTNDYGNWICRYTPKGSRKQESLSARRSQDLVARLAEIRKREEERATAVLNAKASAAR